jgi:hypothetical protein
VTTWLPSFVAGVLGALAGYALSRAALGPATKDILAFVVRVVSGLAIVIARTLRSLATATRDQGIAAVGLDPRRPLLVFSALALGAVAMHFVLSRAADRLQAVSPIAIGGFTAAIVCWTLWRGYWTVVRSSRS